MSIAFFILGLLILGNFLQQFRRLHRLHRVLDNRWRDLEIVLNHRRERLQAVSQHARHLPTITELAERIQEAESQAENALTRGERILAEQQISRLLHQLSEPAVQPVSELAELIEEMQLREQQIADARERYNESAEAWNTYRSTFPVLLLARSIDTNAAPIFVGA